MISSAETVLLVLLILFTATFTRSALGFGDALLAMPLLALAVGIKIAAPLVGFVASTVALSILWQNWHMVDLQAAWRLILSSLLGIPFGLLLLAAAPEEWVKVVLGVGLIGFGLYNLVKPNLPALHGEGLAYLFGFVAGVLGGAYNTNGPPVVIYGTLRRWPPEYFRATLQCYFFPTGLLIIAGHGLTGLWTPAVLWLYVWAVPVIALATLLGGRVNQHIPRDSFNRVIYLFLIVIGILLMI